MKTIATNLITIMAIIKKGTVVEVRHSRSGKWVGIATKDFDTEKEEFYPIALHQEESVSGRLEVWYKGDNMPCRNSLCTITPFPPTVSHECLHCSKLEVAGQCLKCGAPACRECLEKGNC